MPSVRPSLGGFVFNEAKGTLSEEEEREEGERRKSLSFPIFDTNKDAAKKRPRSAMRIKPGREVRDVVVL